MIDWEECRSVDRKVYKLRRSGFVNMLPGDPKGSPDESFLEFWRCFDG